MKAFIQHHLSHFNVDADSERFRRAVMDFVSNRDIKIVLDVGANVGQFGESLREKGYRGKIVSFEPIPSAYQTLAAKAKADGNWDAHNFALGAAPERTTINVADSSLFISLLPATHAAAEFAETAVATHPETIEVRTLNEAVSGTSGNTLLKIDTQGYEKQVLEGGRQMLSTLTGILIELPIIHIYEGTWQFHDAIAFMAANGFVPAQFHPVNFHPKDEVSLVEVDCLFRPRDKRLD